MMNEAGIPVPPPGGAIVLPVDVMPAARVRIEHSGIVVSRDGHIAVCTEGTGLGVKLNADEASALGLLLLKIGGVLQDQADAAADAATKALERITREVAGNA